MMMAGAHGAEVYTLSVPDYHVNPGDTVKVPVSLDNATSLAQLRVQLNYDPQVLSFVSATAGALGEQFDFTHEDDEGTVAMDFVRATSLMTGTGQLVVLEFQANPGATVDLYSDLAIAKFEIGDDSGVRDITVNSSRKIVSGSVSVSLANNIDNAANGIPDWWEELHSMNVLRMGASDLDDDGDGLKNIFEYHLGGNPHLNDTAIYGPKFGFSADKKFTTLTYQRRQGAEGELLSVWESEDLDNWWKLDTTTQMPAAAVDLGNGFEKVTLQGLLSVGDSEGPGRGFLRLQADPSE
jgi:hypothetical protein